MQSWKRGILLEREFGSRFCATGGKVCYVLWALITEKHLKRKNDKSYMSNSMGSTSKQTSGRNFIGKFVLTLLYVVSLKMLFLTKRKYIVNDEKYLR